VSKRSGFMRLPGDKSSIEYEATERKVVMHFDVLPEFCYFEGTEVQRGYSAVWIDAAMAQLVSRVTSGEYAAATLEMKLNYVQPVIGRLVTAEASIERIGRSVAFLEGCLLDEESKLLIAASSTIMLVRANND
jgi:uncharacterized protein (TIGR00369 family)